MHTFPGKSEIQGGFKILSNEEKFEKNLPCGPLGLNVPGHIASFYFPIIFI